MAGTGATISSVTAAMRTLRDAPSVAERYMAMNQLLMLDDADPMKRKAMANAGLIGLLVSLSVDIQGHPEAMMFSLMAPAFACSLLNLEGTAAARDLERAIRAPEPAQTFAALVMLQVRPFWLLYLVLASPWTGTHPVPVLKMCDSYYHYTFPGSCLVESPGCLNMILQ